jgi:hypothetical protein
MDVHACVRREAEPVIYEWTPKTITRERERERERESRVERQTD